MIAPLPRSMLLRSLSAAPLVDNDCRGSEAMVEDAALVQLGDLLLSAWAEEVRVSRLDEASEEEVFAACAAPMRIADRIEALRASSVAGLTVKALACAWCHGDYGDVYDPQRPKAPQECRLADGIVGDLLAMRVLA
ncbi:hypothetical protein ABZT49_16115 [Methylobacterium sp. EM32]|uniref:hypothetical protein n=1 Tax=Methylobacterium sp. EM32 TaxID=3163481 RepID=UPI0033ADB20E